MLGSKDEIFEGFVKWVSEEESASAVDDENLRVL